MLDAEASRTANLLGALALALDDAQRAAASAAAGGLGATACAALVTLGAPSLGAPLTVGGLAAVLGLSHSAAARLAADLAHAGLVVRARAGVAAPADGPAQGVARRADDRRKVALTLTREGTARRAALLAARARALGDALDGLTPRARGALVPALDALLARLTPDRPACDRICRLCDEDACPQPRCPVELAARRAERAAAP